MAAAPEDVRWMISANGAVDSCMQQQLEDLQPKHAARKVHAPAHQTASKRTCSWSLLCIASNNGPRVAPAPASDRLTFAQDDCAGINALDALCLPTAWQMPCCSLRWRALHRLRAEGAMDASVPQLNVLCGMLRDTYRAQVFATRPCQQDSQAGDEQTAMFAWR